MVNKYYKKENINGKPKHFTKDFPEEAEKKGPGKLRQGKRG